MGLKTKFFQAFNGLTDRWVKFSSETKKIVAHKRTKGPYSGIPKRRGKE